MEREVENESGPVLGKWYGANAVGDVVESPIPSKDRGGREEACWKTEHWKLRSLSPFCVLL